MAKKFSEKKFGQTQMWQKGEIQRSISLAYESHGFVFRAEATILPAIKNSAPADSPESLAGRCRLLSFIRLPQCFYSTLRCPLDHGHQTTANRCPIFFFEACKHVADYNDAGP
jgi:hypothetical protein